MFGKQEMTELELRKQTLLLESDINRLALLTDCNRLRESLNWTGRIAEAGKAAGPWLPLLAPFAGAAMAFGLKSSSRVLGFATKAIGIAVPLLRIWRTFFEKPKTETEETSSEYE